MNRIEGEKNGLLAIKDYLPSDETCIYCGIRNCDVFFIKGFAHSKCYHKDDKTGS